MAAAYRQLRIRLGSSQPSNPVRIASLAQPAGPMYKALTRAQYVAAHRAAKAGLLHMSDIAGRMANVGIEPVSDRTIREWARREPDLPERLLTSGLARLGDFPQFVSPYLKMPDTAHLAQMQRSATVHPAGMAGGRRAAASFSGVRCEAATSQRREEGSWGWIALGFGALAFWLQARETRWQEPQVPAQRHERTHFDLLRLRS
jgi:hypothetical protein